MNIERKGVKLVSKALIMETRPSVLLMSAAYTFISFLMSFFIVKFSGYYDYLQKVVECFRSTGEMYDGSWPSVTFEAAVFCVLIFAFKIIVDAGFASYCLSVSRGQKTNFKSLFGGFDYPIKAVVAGIVRLFLVTLGSTFFILPGVFFAYQYRLVYYVLADNPELSVWQCMKLSRQIARGRKIKMLNIDLSFIGWFYLAYVVNLIFLPVVDVWLKPYFGITMAIYYNSFAGKGFTWRVVHPGDGGDGPFTGGSGDDGEGFND